MLTSRYDILLIIYLLPCDYAVTGLSVLELTGEVTPDLELLKRANVLVVTPEKVCTIQTIDGHTPYLSHVLFFTSHTPYLSLTLSHPHTPSQHISSYYPYYPYNYVVGWYQPWLGKKRVCATGGTDGD